MEISRAARNMLLLAGLWLFLYGSFALLSPPLLDGNDALQAEAARETLLRGDVVSAYANGTRITEAGQLLRWSSAASMQAFGVNTSAARFPVAAYVLLLLLLTQAFARRCFRSERSAIYASFGLAVGVGMFTLTRVIGAQILNALWCVAAMYFLWRTESRPPERNGDAPAWDCLGIAAACALLLLTSGPLALVLPVGAALLYFVWTRGIAGAVRRLLQLHPVASFVVFAVLSAPWYVAVHRVRRIDWHMPMQHAEPGSLLLAVMTCTLPWGVFLLGAVADVPWRRRASDEGAVPDRTLLLLAIAACVSIAWAVATRQAYALLQALPFCAMLAARWLDREVDEVEMLSTPAPHVAAADGISSVLACLGAVAVMLGCLLLTLRAADSGVELATLLKQPIHGFAARAAWMAQMAGVFREELTLAIPAVAIGMVLPWWLRREGHPHRANVAMAVGSAMFLVATHKALVVYAPIATSQPLAAEIAPALKQSNIVVINGSFEDASSLGFYLKRDNIHVLRSASNAEDPLVETSVSLARRWEGAERVFLMTDADSIPTLPGKAYVLDEVGGKQVLSNRAMEY